MVDEEKAAHLMWVGLIGWGAILVRYRSSSITYPCAILAASWPIFSLSRGTENRCRTKCENPICLTYPELVRGRYPASKLWRIMSDSDGGRIEGRNVTQAQADLRAPWF